MKRRSLIIERRRSDVVRSLNKRRRRENPRTQDLTGRWGKRMSACGLGPRGLSCRFPRASGLTGREPDDDGLRRQTLSYRSQTPLQEHSQATDLTIQHPGRRPTTEW